MKLLIIYLIASTSFEQRIKRDFTAPILKAELKLVQYA